MGLRVHIDKHGLSDCIELAQAAALGAEPWESLLERLETAFPGTKLALTSEQPSPLRNVGIVSHGYEPDLVRDYVDHYSKINPWTSYWEQMPLLRATASDAVLPSDSLTRYEFYEFISRAREAESAAGIKLFQTRDSFAALTLHFGRRQAAQYNVALPAFLNALAPYLRMAIQLNARLADLTEPAPTLERAVRQFVTPAFLLDQDGLLVEANGAGQDLLSDGEAVRLLPSGHLRIAEDAARKRLEIDRSASDPATMPWASRFGQGTNWRFFEFSSAEFDRRVAWVPSPKRWFLAVYEQAPGRRAVAERAREFGLTRQETKVATAIVDGQRVDAIAPSLGISSATVRQHLKSIFAKTQTHRQPELIAKLINSG